MFKSLFLTRISGSLAHKLVHTGNGTISMAQVLAEKPLRPVAPSEMSSTGFSEPLDSVEGKLAITCGPHLLLALGQETRLLPGGVVKDEVKARIRKIEHERGAKVSGKEKRLVKETVIQELLPRAFVKRSRIRAWLDGEQGWLVVDGSSDKRAEAVGSALRKALGSLPVLRLKTGGDVRGILTGWMRGQTPLPDGLVLGQDCEMLLGSDKGAPRARLSNHDLEGAAAREHLKAGEQVIRIGLTWRDRICFTLHENLALTGIRYTDLVTGEAGEAEDPESAAMADLAMMAGEMRSVFAAMTDWFGLEWETYEDGEPSKDEQADGKQASGKQASGKQARSKQLKDAGHG